jgi:hypothetical protein
MLLLSATSKFAKIRQTGTSMSKVRDFIGFLGVFLVIAGLGAAALDVVNMVGTSCRSIDPAACSATSDLLIPAGITAAAGVALFLVAAFVLRRWTETGRAAAIAGDDESATELTEAMA